MGLKPSKTFSSVIKECKKPEYSDKPTLVSNTRYFTDFIIDCNDIKFSIPKRNNDESILYINDISIESMIPFKSYVVSNHGYMKDVYDCVIRLNNIVYFYTKNEDYTHDKTMIDIKFIYNVYDNKYKKSIDTEELNYVTKVINNSNLCSNNVTSDLSYEYYINSVKNNKFVNDIVIAINGLISLQNSIDPVSLIDSISSSKCFKDYLLQSYNDYREIETKSWIQDVEKLLIRYDDKYNTNFYNYFITHNKDIYDILHNGFKEILDLNNISLIDTLNLMQSILLLYIGNINNRDTVGVVSYVSLSGADRGILKINKTIYKSSNSYSELVSKGLDYLKSINNDTDLMISFSSKDKLTRDINIVRLAIPRKECVIVDEDSLEKLFTYITFNKDRLKEQEVKDNLYKLILDCLDITKSDKFIFLTNGLKKTWILN